MKVEIFSDVVCPWCYIGKRRFETALAGFNQRDQLEIVWRSYQLDPHAPTTSDLTVSQMLAKKYGMRPEQTAATINQVTTLAAKEGLEYHLETAKHGNTFDAHRLIQLAVTHKLQDEMEERLFKAYFTEGAALGDKETLVNLAVEVGLEAEEVRAVLESSAYTDEVQADVQRARMLGINGVPFFVIDEKYGVSGAQAAEVFTEVLEKVWHESHPLIQVGNSSQSQKEANACEGDSCAIA